MSDSSKTDELPAPDLSRIPVESLEDVDADLKKLLQRLGIRNIADLLWHLPREIQDLGDVRSVSHLDANRVQTVLGTVLDVDSRPSRKGMAIVTVLIEAKGKRLRGTWFNQPWIRRKFSVGDEVAFSGKPQKRSHGWEMSHPKVQWIDEDHPGLKLGIDCLYPLTDGLKVERLRKVIRSGLEKHSGHVVDPLPSAYRDEHDLFPLQTAVQAIHEPESPREWKRARRRIVHDDLLEFQVGLALRRRAWKGDGVAPAIEVTPRIDRRIRRLFPFEFTRGQEESIAQIGLDLCGPAAMHRLLQADVGAGKTVVAMYAVLATIANGYQAVLMAPTEVLARQHWLTVETALHDSRVNRLFLSGSLTGAEKMRAHEQIANGDAQLIVGTQAVIQDAVRFRRAGLVVIDEQHKFGVLQRSRFSSTEMLASNEASTGSRSQLHLSDKQPATIQDEVTTPHILVMTATPIPRTLCLTQFGDLDVSRIDELPPGRQPIVTGLVTNRSLRDKMFAFVVKQLKSGRQAYVVCPRVEHDADSEMISVEEVHSRLSSGDLAEFRLGLVHGRLAADEKADIMRRFREREIDVLISTTVIEVGVDVANATMMLIYQADAFGLSQLHQLRGRIGRGQFQGYCFLLTKSKTEDAQKRMAAMESTSDGFEIAEIDFEMRGPGDVLGTRQHGELPLRFADLNRDHALLRTVRRAAFKLVQSGLIDTPDFALLKTNVFQRFGERLNLPKSG